jgi:hypothetical protein
MAAGVAQRGRQIVTLLRWLRPSPARARPVVRMTMKHLLDNITWHALAHARSTRRRGLPVR